MPFSVQAECAASMPSAVLRTHVQLGSSHRRQPRYTQDDAGDDADADGAADWLKVNYAGTTDLDDWAAALEPSLWSGGSSFLEGAWLGAEAPLDTGERPSLDSGDAAECTSTQRLQSEVALLHKFTRKRHPTRQAAQAKKAAERLAARVLASELSVPARGESDAQNAARMLAAAAWMPPGTDKLLQEGPPAPDTGSAEAKDAAKAQTQPREDFSSLELEENVPFGLTERELSLHPPGSNEGAFSNSGFAEPLCGLPGADELPWAVAPVSPNDVLGRALADTCLSSGKAAMLCEPAATASRTSAARDLNPGLHHLSAVPGAAGSPATAAAEAGGERQLGSKAKASGGDTSPQSVKSPRIGDGAGLAQVQSPRRSCTARAAGSPLAELAGHPTDGSGHGLAPSPAQLC